MTRVIQLILVCFCFHMIKMDDSEAEMESELVRLLKKVDKMNKNDMNPPAKNDNGDQSASSKMEALLAKINKEIGELQSPSVGNSGNSGEATNVENNALSDASDQGIALVLEALRKSAEKLAKLKQKVEADFDKTQTFADDFVAEMKGVALQLITDNINSTESEESRSFHSRHCVHVFRPCEGGIFPSCCDTDSFEDSSPFEQCCVTVGKLLKIGPIQSNRAIITAGHPPLGVCMPNPFPFKDCPNANTG